jgi:tRNA(Ile)-lysidine synthase
VVGFSGGADSLFLLDLLHRSEDRPTPLVALHVHHGLRGAQADLDEQFCREFCRERGILLEVRHARLDPRAPGLEQRARLARRRFLREVCAKHGLSRILLAHQLEDADETQLMRWLRGSDWSGLSSLRARREWRLDASHTLEIVRPLLELTRESIRASLRARGLAWREDSSNLDRKHSRNRVRADLVPLLGPDFLVALRRLRKTCESLDQRIESLLPRCELQAVAGGLARHPESFSVSLAALRRLPLALACHLLSSALAPRLRTRHATARLEALLACRSVQARTRSGWRLLVRDDATLECTPPPCVYAPAALTLGQAHALGDGRSLLASWLAVPELADWPTDPATVELSCPEPPRELRVDFLRPGQRFAPLGLGGRKQRLVRFLQGARVPAVARREVPLVFLGEELVWVAGLRISHARRITDPTSARLRLCLRGLEG